MIANCWKILYCNYNFKLRLISRKLGKLLFFSINTFKLDSSETMCFQPFLTPPSLKSNRFKKGGGVRYSPFKLVIVLINILISLIRKLICQKVSMVPIFLWKNSKQSEIF